MPSQSRDVLTRLQPAVPPALVERAAGWSSGTRAVEPARSASVVLLRDGPAGLETYLLHRHARMAFAASMVVFPGGRLDPGDAPEAEMAQRLRTCARRETAEETGIRLDDEALLDWAHWTTPEVEPRRYDTRFFLAALPVDQQAADISGETDNAEWSTAAAALTAYEQGTIALMPPTLSILLELVDLPDLAAVQAEAQDRVVEPVLPVVVRDGDGWAFRYPRTGDE